MTRPPDPLIYAHRGASADHPENTVAAFHGAREQGADRVELDVRLTHDGGLVVHHDPVFPMGEWCGTRLRRSVRRTPSSSRSRSTPAPAWG